MSLSNSQYGAIMREYDRRQILAQRRKEARVSEAEQAIPALTEVEAEIARLSLQAAKAALAGDEEGKRKASSKLRDMREEKEALLLGAGFPADYMEMVYTCPLCRDTGYVGQEKCRCFRQLEASRYVEESGLKDVLETENFDAYREDWYDDRRVLEPYGETVREHMRGVYQICRRYATEFSRQGESLLLTGPAGTGKTFFTHCIAAELLKEGYGVLYVTASGLTDLFSGRFEDSGRERFQEDKERLLHCDLLVLDDLGTEWNNAYTNSELFAVLNERLRGKRPCVISTNLSLQGLSERYSERILSRIMGNYRILELIGDDLRIRNKYQ